MQGIPRPPAGPLPVPPRPFPGLPTPPANNIVPLIRNLPKPVPGPVPILSKIRPGPAGLLVLGLALALWLWEKFKNPPATPSSPWVEWIGPKPTQPGTYQFETVTGWRNEGYDEEGYYSENYVSGTLLSIEKEVKDTGLAIREFVKLTHYINGVSVNTVFLPQHGSSLGDTSVLSFQIKATLLNTEGGGDEQPELPDGSPTGKPPKRVPPPEPDRPPLAPGRDGPDGIPGTPDDLPGGQPRPDPIPPGLKPPKPYLDPRPNADPKTPPNPNPVPFPGVDPLDPEQPSPDSPPTNAPSKTPKPVGDGLPEGYKQPNPLPKPEPQTPRWWEYITPVMPATTGPNVLRPPTPPIPGPYPPVVTPRPVVDPLNPPTPQPEPLSPACQQFADWDYCKNLGPDSGGTDPVTCKFTPTDLTPLSAQIAAVDAKVVTVNVTTAAHSASWAGWLAGPWTAFSNAFTAFNQFVHVAFEATKMDKVLNAMNHVLLIHNAAMLSRSLAESLAETTGTVLNAIGIKDHEGNAIDVPEVLGNTFQNWIKGIIGETLFTSVTKAWAKMSAIWSSAANIVYTMRGIADTSQEVMEWIGENTGKIGNALKSARVVGENAYKWMPERITTQGVFKRKLDKFVDGLESVENISDSVSEVTSNTKEIVDEVNELKEEREKFQEALEDAIPKSRPDNTAVKDARQAQIADSQGATPQPIDEERNIPDD